jgi:hybrid cluster-associated redox disulfide protein
MPPVVTRTLTVAELLMARPAAAAAFAVREMACVGCPMARFETLAEVAAAYGVELDALLEDVARRASVSRQTRSRRAT